MPDSTDKLEQGQSMMSGSRWVAAALVGLLGSLLIWTVTPFFYYIVRVENITDSYLPASVLFLLVVLVLVVNPLLRKLCPLLVLSPRQLALAVGMMLVACVLPIQGVMFQLPYTLAGTCTRVNTEKPLADVYLDVDLPESLFPDKLGYGLPTPASDALLNELFPGQPMPWGAWLGPLLSWGAFMLFFGLISMGLSMIVLPQWRHNERLAFPLLDIYQPLTAEPGEGRLLPDLLHNRCFWVGAGVVFALYFLVSANAYFPDRVPAIPLSWNLSRCFTEEPLIYLPVRIHSNQVYFLFVGIAFFMPTRISFSIWFMTILYTAYIVIGRAYLPPFHYATISDHRSGAILVMTLVVLWLGRQRWRDVAKALVRASDTAAARRDRKAAWMFLAGLAGLFTWFVWAGAQMAWALFFVAICFMVCLLITRFVAETGMPFFRIDGVNADIFMGMVPLSWLGPGTVFMSGVCNMMFQMGSRVSAMTMGTHALALDEELAGDLRDDSIVQQHRTSWLFVAVLLVGMAVCGAATVYFSSRHSVTLDGEASAIGATRMFNVSHSLLLARQRGQLPQTLYHRPAHLAFGATLAGLLQWACTAMPKWPLHPIGILIVYTYFGSIAWASIFLGWLLKVLLVRYGGSRLYRAAKPFFLGVIVGEVLSAMFWSIVPCILVALGRTYTTVRIQPP